MIKCPLYSNSNTKSLPFRFQNINVELPSMVAYYPMIFIHANEYFLYDQSQQRGYAYLENPDWDPLPSFFTDINEVVYGTADTPPTLKGSYSFAALNINSPVILDTAQVADYPSDSKTIEVWILLGNSPGAFILCYVCASTPD